MLRLKHHKGHIALAVLLLAGGSMAVGPISTGDFAEWRATPTALYVAPSDTNVGVGTQAPFSRLQVFDGADAGLHPNRSGFLMLGGGSGAQNLILDNNEIMARRAWGLGTLYLQHDGGPLRVHGAAAGADPFEITAEGRVIIGRPNTTHPFYELQVEGGIVAEEVRVTMDGWADDVLAPGYALPSLEDIAAQIRRDGHLAGMPREEEVVRDGVDLAEVTRTLVARVEELTLHTIRQEKEIARLRRALRAAQKGRE